MSIAPLPVAPRQPRSGPQRTMGAAVARMRRPPTPGREARRRLFILLSKFLLPVAALALLVTIAMWPELQRATDKARIAMRQVSGEVQGATLTDAVYHGVDDHGRPYTLTAATAQQVGPERINLTIPKGDITLANGTWLMVQAKDGVFMQHINELDLSHDVTLYRDDGTTMLTQSAAIDMKNGAAAGAEPVHAEGPFGVLDAQGFTLTDKGSNIQFTGPAHLVLNGSSP
jgi:lipopolysaccharide export system protein LptC